MADLNAQMATPAKAATETGDGDGDTSRGVVDDVAVRFVELLFFAYRDFTHEPDDILIAFGFGRAHHRVLHFVHRNPGLRVTDLLEVLRITKQSLARVLKQLIKEGFIRQEPGRTDRRERHLFVTERGRSLAEELLHLQTQRIGQALTAAGPDAEAIVGRFLMDIVTAEDREAVEQLIQSTRANE